VLGRENASRDALEIELGRQEEEQEKDNAVAGALQGMEHKPDQRAKDQVTATQANVPVAAIGDNTRADVEFQNNLQLLDKALGETPALRRPMANPEFAAVAQDDLEKLSNIDRIARAYSRGQDLHALGLAGAEFRRTRSEDARRNIEEIQLRLKTLGHDDENDFIGWLSSAAEVVGQMMESFDSPALAVRVGGGIGIGATIGAIGGPLAPITSTAGGLMGAGAGLMSHIVADTFEVEGGLAYIEELEICWVSHLLYSDFSADTIENRCLELCR